MNFHRTRPLRFESLEDRRMHAVLTVENLFDDSLANLAGDGQLSFREAIQIANNPGLVIDGFVSNDLGDEIHFSVDGTIHLTSQLPTIASAMSIDGGGGPITISGAGGTGGGAYRIFNIDNGNTSQIEVSLIGLSLTGGNSSGNGGAILNAENLTVTGTTIGSNYAVQGGGIYNTGTMHLENVTIANNETLFGGGGIANTGPAELESVTIVGNDGGAGNGGGISTGSNLSLNNSVMAKNTKNSGQNDISGSVASGSSFNFFETGNPSFSTGGLMNGVNGNIIGNGAGGFLSARLSTLDYFGGAVPTFVPLAGSPLINNGDDTIGATSDARGVLYLRNDGTGVDIGAVERQTLPELTLVVDAIDDEYDGDFSQNHLSLREALALVNGSAGANAISFSELFDSPQTIALGSQLRIWEDVTIDGAGKLVTLDAGGGTTASPGDGHRVFRIDDGVASIVLDVTLRGLTLTGGDPRSNESSGQGGAIFNTENLTLRDSTLTANTALFGGGISSTTNLVRVENSTFSANHATNQGGGIYLSSGTLDIVSSTFTLNNSTIQGGGIFINAGNVTVNSSIVAGNTAPSNADVAGTLTINTFNLIGGNPLLLPLADYGGSTPTHALSLLSPAINTGDPAITTGADQRGAGFGRVELGRADIGAFEYQEARLPSSLIVSNSGDTVDEDFSSGELTLREAIQIANLRPGADTIDFDPTLFSTPQTITTASQLDIAQALTINGPGQDFLTIDGGLGGDGLLNGNGHSLLRILSPVVGAYTVEISGLVLTGSDGTNAAIFSGANLFFSDVTIQNNSGLSVGGIIMLSDAALAVEDSLFLENRARDTSIDDLHTGAILGGNISILRSTFANNVSSFGASAVNALGITRVLSITDSTFHDNTATLGASAVRISGPTANIVNSTFSANQLGQGVVSLSGGTLDISHTTFAESSLADLRILSGTANVTHTILGSVTGTLATSTFNLIGGDAMLGPLADNGGPTLTRALLTGSPAIDAGDPSFTSPPEFDQRGLGFDRISGGRIDIGAYEVQSTILPGDFDFDGDVDGRDFLAWQRGQSPTPLSAGDLSDWQENYGEPESLGAGALMTERAGVSPPPVRSEPAISKNAASVVVVGLGTSRLAVHVEGEGVERGQRYTEQLDRALETLPPLQRFGVREFGEFATRHTASDHFDAGALERVFE